MSLLPRTADLLAGVTIAPEVHDLVPDYRALIVMAEGLTPGPSDATSEAILAAAEKRARELLGDNPPEHLPHVEEWRAAYRAFGARPQRTRPSVDALLRRVAGGLPRINRLTDAYNAVSIAHVLPLGGEDLSAYAGSPALVRASGDEVFETVAAGEAVVEHPAAGEVLWRDELGVTCRMWNWRQCRRTLLTEETTEAVFILDGLGALGADGLEAAGDALIEHLTMLSPGASFGRRTLGR
jgi:DNA/RNA-binding domain of Phe-tRNA-synthetase-like protein